MSAHVSVRLSRPAVWFSFVVPCVFSSLFSIAGCPAPEDPNNNNNNNGNDDAGTNPETDAGIVDPDAGENPVDPVDPDAIVYPEDANVYAFSSRFVENTSSVSYTGQLLRHLLIAELKAYIGALDATAYQNKTKDEIAADLWYFYDFKNQGGTVDEPITVKAFETEILQKTFGEVASPASLREKMADFDLSSDLTVIGYGDGTLSPSAVAEDMIDRLAILIERRAAGDIPVGPDGVDIAKVYLDENGIDYQQLIQKYLDASVAFSQACDDYLDDDVAGKGLLSDNAGPEIKDGNPLAYTSLEHAWDEGFGYFGASIYFADLDLDKQSVGFFDHNNDGKADWKTEVSMGHARLAAVRDVAARNAANADFADTQIAQDAIRAFIDGRALISNARGALSAEQLDVLRAHRDTATQAWENALGATMVHYINRLLQIVSSDDATYRFADHAKFWAELKGMALAANFNPRSPLAPLLPYVHTFLGDKPILGRDPESIAAQKQALLDARSVIAGAFGFSAAAVGDENGQGGW